MDRFVAPADRISEGSIPLDEALPIARQIVDALECAHEQGIIHRDLKPANIKVRPDGTVKVLDFGLAKALDPVSAEFSRPDQSPTLTARSTQLGMIVGTAACMAPEQARGRVVDRRADIWAFGVVLYEMLTGRRAFQGDDISITLAAVLKDEVAWKALPADLPPSLRRLLRRCLDKDPKRRLSAIGDARLELEDVTEGAAVASGHALAAQPGWRRALPWSLAAIMTGATVTSIALWAPWRAPVADSPVRVSVDIGVDGPLAVNMGAGAVISPDGKVAVFVVPVGGRNVLYVRHADQLNSTLLTGTDDAHSPFFSPDSEWIGFFTSDKLKKVAVAGGAIVTLGDAPNGRGGAWGRDGSIIFQPNSSPQRILSESEAIGAVLHQVSDAGGTATPFGKLAEGEMTQRWPQVLPNGKGVVYSSNTATIAWDTGKRDGASAALR
jgi:serine/threonine-protein kinase